MLSHPLGTGYQLLTKPVPLQQQRRAVVTTSAPQTYTLTVILFSFNLDDGYITEASPDVS
jgi:hypothetical protein